MILRMVVWVMGLMLSKPGLPLAPDALIRDMFMVERWFVLSGKEIIREPYDVQPEEIVTAHVDFRNSLLRRGTEPPQIERGTRNVKQFVRAARTSDSTSSSDSTMTMPSRTSNRMLASIWG